MLHKVALLLVATSCIPIFSGEGEEVKSVSPGATVGGVHVAPTTFLTVEKAHPERHFQGRLLTSQGGRQVPVRYVKVCVLDKVKNEIDCGSSDAMGQYSLQPRLEAGDYFLSVQSAGLKKEREIKITDQKEFTTDFVYER